MAEDLEKVREKIEELKRRRALDPNFGRVKHSPTGKREKMTAEEKEAYKDFKRKVKSGEIGVE